MSHFKPKNILPVGLILLLTSCAPPPTAHERDIARIEPQKASAQPDFPGYGSKIAKGPMPWSADSLADDFVNLTFATEWGYQYEHLRRWDVPVRIDMTDPVFAPYQGYLADLLDMIRETAPDLDIASASDGNITLRTAPKAEMLDLAKSALCFITPGDVTWTAYKERSEGGKGGSWEDVKSFDQMTIFIPSNSRPYEIRACIVEEVIQALGPVNDVFSLEDSVFNDDNAHYKPTKFDLTMLRTLYDPRMKSGMTRKEARAVARAILGETVFGGRLRRTNVDPQSDTTYRTAIRSTWLTKDTDLAIRLLEKAAGTALHFDPNDPRYGHANLLMSGYFLSDDLYEDARDAATEALEHYQQMEPAVPLRVAHAKLRLAVINTFLKKWGTAADLADEALPVFAAHGIEQKVARSLRLTAYSRAINKEFYKARRREKRATPWISYAYGSDSAALSDWQEIASKLKRL